MEIYRQCSMGKYANWLSRRKKTVSILPPIGSDPVYSISYFYSLHLSKQNV